MKVTHEIEVRGLCPVDLSFDVYQVKISSMKIVKVEEIISVVNALKWPLYQEEMTQKLAEELQCSVCSVGYHSGVKTTVEV